MTEVSSAENTQDAPAMPAMPQAEHDWLHKLIGDWSTEGECIMEPGTAAEKTEGEASVRSLGGLWVVSEGAGEASDEVPMNSLMTLGYDPQKQRFVGSFIASCMAELWTYEGELDAAGKVLTLHAEGPSFAGDGTKAPYKDTIEIHDDDHWTMKSQTLVGEGQWFEFMTVHYRRKV